MFTKNDCSHLDFKLTLLLLKPFNKLENDEKLIIENFIDEACTGEGAFDENDLIQNYFHYQNDKYLNFEDLEFETIVDNYFDKFQEYEDEC